SEECVGGSRLEAHIGSTRHNRRPLFTRPARYDHTAGRLRRHSERNLQRERTGNFSETNPYSNKSARDLYWEDGCDRCTHHHSYRSNARDSARYWNDYSREHPT